jgi:hypothetical protein
LLWGTASALGAPLRLPPVPLPSLNGTDAYWYQDTAGNVRLATANGNVGIFVAPDGRQTFNRVPICNLAPTANNHLVNKEYVDSRASSPYVLPAATTSTLGGVVVGSGLAVGTDGTLSAAQARVVSVTAATEHTINSDTTDLYVVTEQVVACSVSISGTPIDGQTLIVRIKAATKHDITWGPAFLSSGVASLPAAAAAGKTITAGLIYDAAAAKWVCLAVDGVGY